MRLSFNLPFLAVLSDEGAEPGRDSPPEDLPDTPVVGSEWYRIRLSLRQTRKRHKRLSLSAVDAREWRDSSECMGPDAMALLSVRK